MTVGGTTLNLVVIRSADIERAVRFYRALGLSFVQERHGEGALHYASTNGDVVFEIYSCTDMTQVSVNIRLGFRVSSIDEVLQVAVENGGQVASGAKSSPWGRRATVIDPDGRKVDLLDVDCTPS